MGRARQRLRPGGYAVTSHSSLGQTADHVLIKVDTELGEEDLLSDRMASVAVSRDASDAQLFTNDREMLGTALGTISSGTVPKRLPGSNGTVNRFKVKETVRTKRYRGLNKLRALSTHALARAE